MIGPIIATSRIRSVILITALECTDSAEHEFLLFYFRYSTSSAEAVVFSDRTVERGNGSRPMREMERLFLMIIFPISLIERSYVRSHFVHLLHIQCSTWPLCYASSINKPLLINCTRSSVIAESVWMSLSLILREKLLQEILLSESRIMQRSQSSYSSL
ncbi:uncharacterized protein F5891DRAFT_1052354 [Suillus fuscotomentosus]|uniref:Uncharacterized protein n=1 Tax=Suillus fuscotomentosus TaxID=1912939 RepID=A0AAD4E202_9AGAM|nr:uncharacterized protein F5891DRAFT_1052354 [Suillus fuscotomentosus]KAG1896823.1 hypothetical protein F5891DRAFT_1052354 [Suillus fuscotomentosus]